MSFSTSPAAFIAFRQQTEAIGFRHGESGPTVRWSYHADEQVLKMQWGIAESYAPSG